MNDIKSNILKISGVDVIYNNEILALKNVTFDLNKSTIAALVGMNGSGKSTLFKAIMGFAPMPMFASFGQITSIMIFLALISSVFVLPSLLVIVSKK